LNRLLKGVQHSSRKHRDRAAGDLARNARDWQSAINHYENHLKRNPADFGIAVQLGHAFKEAGRFERALEAYTYALTLNALDHDLYLQLGHLEKLRGNIDIATEMYAKSIELGDEGEARRELLSLRVAPIGLSIDPGMSPTHAEPRYTYEATISSRVLGTDHQQRLIQLKNEISDKLLTR
jgi:tetratricopeptide (TPR) repeat protein